jgi:DNA-binding MarR family transcriptional regulator
MAILLRTTEDYLEELAATFSDGLRRGTIAPLMVLHRVGPLRVSELAEALGLDRTTVTRHLDELEPRGLVTRRPDERDRRALVVSLTPAAAEHLDAMRTRNRQRIMQVCADWTPEEREMFGRLLPRFARESAPIFNGSSTTRASAARRPVAGR